MTGSIRAASLTVALPCLITPACKVEHAIESYATNKFYD
jgi:hypothetical protein